MQSKQKATCGNSNRRIMFIRLVDSYQASTSWQIKQAAAIFRERKGERVLQKKDNCNFSSRTVTSPNPQLIQISYNKWGFQHVYICVQPVCVCACISLHALRCNGEQWCWTKPLFNLLAEITDQLEDVYFHQLHTPGGQASGEKSQHTCTVDLTAQWKPQTCVLSYYVSSVGTFDY